MSFHYEFWDRNILRRLGALAGRWTDMRSRSDSECVDFVYYSWYLVVPPVAFTEIKDEPLQDELSYLREFGVDDGHHGGVDVGEDGRRALSLEHRSGQETPMNHTRTLLLDQHMTNDYSM